MMTAAALQLEQPCDVLVVDDDPGIREMTALILQDAGYRVATAVHGADALSLLEQIAPRLIVLDMRMPVLDGWGFARELDQRDGHRPAIVVVTAARNARAWANEIGANAYLAKPFDLDELLTVVGQLLPAPQSA